MPELTHQKRRVIEELLPKSRLWTLQEVARYLNVSMATVRRWTTAGRLPCYRLGGHGERRFSHEQVLEFLAQHEHRGTRP